MLAAVILTHQNVQHNTWYPLCMRRYLAGRGPCPPVLWSMYFQHDGPQEQGAHWGVVSSLRPLPPHPRPKNALPPPHRQRPAAPRPMSPAGRAPLEPHPSLASLTSRGVQDEARAPGPSQKQARRAMKFPAAKRSGRLVQACLWHGNHVLQPQARRRGGRALSGTALPHRPSADPTLGPECFPFAPVTTPLSPSVRPTQPGIHSQPSPRRVTPPRPTSPAGLLVARRLCRHPLSSSCSRRANSSSVSTGPSGNVGLVSASVGTRGVNGWRGASGTPPSPSKSSSSLRFFFGLIASILLGRRREASKARSLTRRADRDCGGLQSPTKSQMRIL